MTKLEPLQVLLNDVKVLVEKFGKKGFFKQMLKMQKYTKNLKKLDDQIVDLFQSLKDMTNLSQQQAILESMHKLTAAQSYPVVQAIADETDKQVKLYENGGGEERNPKKIYDLVVAKMVSWVCDARRSLDQQNASCYQQNAPESRRAPLNAPSFYVPFCFPI